ncbi:beta-2-microglobulin-like [Pelobates cultripes]|uniref:Beta-2-microglobulin-like n=1 Tax=Pelobates cultripes TaxID=61616 RepID=A0AAD1WGA6_PELCU|nr:beta-2-microglobulin-like [Pelobates cultripes]CAH2307980.1 beta-2-microglobulin-like [Pelobates cultripes]
MKLLIASAVFLLGLSLAWADTQDIRDPKVRVYLEKPVEFGVKNKMLCYAYDFHPPLIKIGMYLNKEEVPNAHQNDMKFNQDWSYEMLKYVEITPNQGDKATCTVSHNGQEPKTYELNWM